MPVRAGRPLRNQDVAVGDHTLQRAAGRQQLGLGLGRGHAVDERVDGRVLDAGEVARVLHVGGLAAEHVGELLARGCCVPA
jgi:hypothetical protein